MKKSLVSVTLSFLFLCLKGQFSYYVQPQSWPIFENNTMLSQAFTGGLNAVNISKADIDLDGFKDLGVFDKADQKMHIYIYNPSTNNYIYNPKFTEKMPKLITFGLFKDYNNDNIPDIFTIVRPNLGFSLYRGSISNNQLTFSLQKSYGIDYLCGLLYPSFQPNIVYNISLGSDQIPGIYDYDNDGDLDVFHYSTTNPVSIIQAFRNTSVEQFGISDSLHFTRFDDCYGKFSETPCGPFALYPNSKTVYTWPNGTIDTLCGLKFFSGKPLPNTNTGLDTKLAHLDPNTSMLMFDPNRDGNLDILMTDKTCDSIRFLKGVNVIGQNVIKKYTSVYPTVANPIKMRAPTAYYEDIDNDGLKDLVFCTNNTDAIAKKSIWYYKNIATNVSQPDTFALITKGFLQDNTVDVGLQSHPVLFDIDNDGDQDLFIGSGIDENNVTNIATSSVYFYKNTGTFSNPSFSLVTDDFIGLRSTNLKFLRPAFGDLDNDGDADLILGAGDGKFYYYNHSGSIDVNGIPVYNFVANKFPNTYTANNNSSPVIVDINNDGWKDVISGRSNGTLCLIKQTGLNVFNFVKPWGGVDLKASSNLNNIIVPSILRFANKNYLVIGGPNGMLHLYDDLSTVTNDTLNELDTNILHFKPYFNNSSSSIADIDGDNKPDFILGNLRGGIYGFKGDTVDFVSVLNKNLTLSKGNLFPNPAKNSITITNVNKNSNITIINALGIEMNKSNPFIFRNNSAILDVSNLSSGFYYVYINSATTYKIAYAFVKE